MTGGNCGCTDNTFFVLVICWRKDVSDFVVGCVFGDDAGAVGNCLVGAMDGLGGAPIRTLLLVAEEATVFGNDAVVVAVCVFLL